ncbi:hypothetical protein [Streptomyces sp. NPDC047061]|uniref:hypothetical protein n=1 Tax=Streptomyces sp. NPDC047061 TaxID=3154605 RepID=UPI0033E1C42F
MTGIQYFWRHPLAEQVREEGRVEGRREAQSEAWSEGWEEGFRAGRLRERYQMVVSVLEWRGISVGDAVRARVNASKDPDELTTWVIRALRADDAEEIFVDV